MELIASGDHCFDNQIKGKYHLPLTSKGDIYPIKGFQCIFAFKGRETLEKFLKYKTMLILDCRIQMVELNNNINRIKISLSI